MLLTDWPSWVEELPIEFWDDREVLELVLKYRMRRLRKLTLATELLKDEES